jgi:tetratricopeptide (TPR) repeat protein
MPPHTCHPGCYDPMFCAQGNNQQAIKHLKRVLAISEQLEEYTGDADAYGSIADIYADMGEFEKAAEYYDNYINKMQEDGQAV